MNYFVTKLSTTKPISCMSVFVLSKLVDKQQTLTNVM